MATHLFLFIHDVLYAHIMYMLHKNLCVNKRIFHIEVTLPTKIMWVTKKYVVATKKIMWHRNKRFKLTKYV